MNCRIYEYSIVEIRLNLFTDLSAKMLNFIFAFYKQLRFSKSGKDRANFFLKTKLVKTIEPHCIISTFPIKQVLLTTFKKHEFETFTKSYKFVDLVFKGLYIDIINFINQPEFQNKSSIKINECPFNKFGNRKILGRYDDKFIDVPKKYFNILALLILNQYQPQDLSKYDKDLIETVGGWCPSNKNLLLLDHMDGQLNKLEDLHNEEIKKLKDELALLTKEDIALMNKDIEEIKKDYENKIIETTQLINQSRNIFL